MYKAIALAIVLTAAPALGQQYQSPALEKPRVPPLPGTNRLPPTVPPSIGDSLDAAQCQLLFKGDEKDRPDPNLVYKCL